MCGNSETDSVQFAAGERVRQQSAGTLVHKAMLEGEKALEIKQRGRQRHFENARANERSQQTRRSEERQRSSELR